MFFLRKSRLERLPVVMSGVLMCERLLQIGVDDPALAGAIASKVGLSGHSAIAVTTEAAAATARDAASTAGALTDIHVAPFDALPLADGSFDVLVLHANGVDTTLDGAGGLAMLRQAHRVLRPGGRLIVIAGGRRGLIARFGGAGPAGDAGTTIAALNAAGLRPARLLAEREGYRFIEGLKPQ